MTYKIDTELTLQFFQIMAGRDLEGLREFIENIKSKNLCIISVINGTTMSNEQEHEFNERFNADNTKFYESPRDDFFTVATPRVWVGWMGDRVVEFVEKEAN
jgi:hypothetical protein